MKIKKTLVCFIIIFFVLLGIGLYVKSTYMNFNEETEPLSNFTVGIITDDMLSYQLENFKENLDSSNIIIAARCIDEPEFRYKTITQKVVITQIFKGSGIGVGDEIEISRSGNSIYWNSDDGSDNAINLGYVNVMKQGEVYLIFLDGRVQNNYDDNIIYKTGDKFAMAPIFCYTDLQTYSTEPMYEDYSVAWYEDVKDSEFFVSSDVDIEKLLNFKKEIIEKYSLD